MRYYKDIVLFIGILLAPTFASGDEGLVECPTEVFPKSELTSFMSVGEKFVGCDKQFISNAELCECAKTNSSLLQSNSQKEAMAQKAKEASEQAWEKSYRKEFLSIAQDFYDLDAMTKNNLEDAKFLKDNISPSCNISSILNSVGSHASSEGCDQEIFKKRVKAVFGKEDLTEIQKEYGTKLTRLIENKVPEHLENSPNVCLPYSTYNYSKNMDILNGMKSSQATTLEEKVLKVRVEQVNKRCLKLQDSKVADLFCKQDLPELPLEVYQNSVSPELSNGDSFTMANLVSSEAYCSNTPSENEKETPTPLFNITNSPKTDFETFVNGEAGDYEKFNQSVCQFLPKCKGGNTTGNNCRNILNLRQMTLDKIEEDLKSKGINDKLVAELMNKFAYDPESIVFSEVLKKLLNKAELSDVKGFLTYLNNFIIDKSEGGQTLLEIAEDNDNNQLTASERRKMILKEATLRAKAKTPITDKDNPEGEVGSIKTTKTKPEKREVPLTGDRKFQEKRRLTATQFDLDDIEESVLSKKFLEGPPVVQPELTSNQSSDEDRPSPTTQAPTNTPSRDEPTISNAPSAPVENQTSPSRNTTPESSSPVRQRAPSVSNTQGSNNLSNIQVPTGSSYVAPRRRRNSFRNAFSNKSRTARTVKAKPASSTSGSFKDPYINRGRNQGNKSFNEEINRYKNALGGLPDAPSTASPSDQETQPGRDIASTDQAPGQEKEFEGQETSKKKKSGSAGSRKAGALSKKKTEDSEDDLITDAKGNKGYRGADGKFVPAFVYKFVLPHLIVDVFGVEEVVKKYKLYGKRFHTLEITDEETFILHTYDFQSSSVPYTSELDDPEYNKVRQEILEQVQLTIAQSRSSKVLNKILEKTDHREERIVKTEVEQIRLSEKMIPFEDVEERFAQN